MSHNQISDVTPLSALVNLHTLYLNANQISDVTPLSALVNLKLLTLHENQIIDVTKRNFDLLVTSPLFAEKRKCLVSAGSVRELVAGVRTYLEIEQDIVIIIYDEDFEEHRQVCDLDDIEKDKARITVKLKQ
eukprot:SAG11_NODE_49_length_19996_cov_13.133588_5_plen_132_part_00